MILTVRMFTTDGLAVLTRCEKDMGASATFFAARDSEDPAIRKTAIMTPATRNLPKIRGIPPGGEGCVFSFFMMGFLLLNQGHSGAVMRVWIDEERISCKWVELLFGIVSPVRFLYQLSM